MKEHLHSDLYMHSLLTEARLNVERQQKALKLRIKNGRFEDYLTLKVLLDYIKLVTPFELDSDSDGLANSRKRVVESSTKEFGKEGYQILLQMVPNIVGFSTPIPTEGLPVSTPDLWRNGYKSVKGYMDTLKEGEVLTSDRMEFIEENLPPFLAVLHTEIDTI